MGEQELDQLTEIGSIFEEKFQILGVLGRGANGTVYEARHVLLSQKVALKVLNSISSDPETASKRFQKEASLLSSFDHPNIVKLHSYGLLPDGRQYMALEYVEGSSLADLLSTSAALECEAAIAIFQQICAGLAYAHSRGVIHRDIKPGNIIISPNGNVKILDFGIFKSLDSLSQSLTKTGYMLGSANYMSPEQCKQHELDQRSDIYSLGCLMYECMVGQAPMQESSDMAIMSNHLQKIIDVVPARHGISGELQNTILKSLEKDVSKRFQSASELERALEDCKNASLLESKSETAKSRKLVVGLVAAVVLVVACLTVLAFWRGEQTKKALSGIKISTDQALYDAGKLPPPDSMRTPKAIEQRELWIKKNARSPDAKKLLDQYVHAYHDRKFNKMPLPPPYGDLVRDRLESFLEDKQSYSLGRFGLIRDLAYLNAMLGDEPAVLRYIDMLEVKGEPALEGNRTKALARAIMNVMMIYQARDMNKEALVLVKRLDDSSLEGEDKISFYDSLAATYIQLKDLDRAEPYAVESAKLFLQRQAESKQVVAGLAHPVIGRLNQVKRSDLALKVAKVLPDITKALKQKDASWRRIECELANAYAAQGDYEKAKRIYLSNIEEIRNTESAEEVLSAEIYLLKILHFLKADQKELLEESRKFLNATKSSSYVTASNSVVSLLIEWGVDASSLIPLIISKAEALHGMDPNRALRLYEIVGRIYLQNKNIQMTLDCYEHARKLAVAVGNVEAEGGAMNGKMGCLIHLKEPDAFEREYKAVRALKGLSPDLRFITQQLYGERFEFEHQYQKAIDIYEPLLRPYSAKGASQLPGNYADCVLHLAICYKELGKPEKAIQVADDGISMVKRFRKQSSAMALYDYAIKLCEASDPAKAAKYRKYLSKLQQE